MIYYNHAHNKEQSKKDFVLSWIVVLQPILLIFQIILTEVFGLPENLASTYRVFLTAVPIIIGLIICIRNDLKKVIFIYVITLCILWLNLNFFPKNEEYLLYDSLRFLLPVVIPTAICTMCISSFKTFWSISMKMSWIIFFLTLFYIYKLLSGAFIFSGYNMSLSYALLLPMLILFSTHTLNGIGAALFLFSVTVIIGSRGASIAFVIFAMYDIIIMNKKLLAPIICVILLMIFSLPYLMDVLYSYGIQSRTLEFIFSDELISNDSGRTELHQKIIPYIWENPILGNGLWGDRPVLNTYSHNIFIELYVDWGIFFGSIIILLLAVYIIRVYYHSDSRFRYLIILFTIGILLPLNVSGSYLISYNLALYIGILYLINKTISRKN